MMKIKSRVSFNFLPITASKLGLLMVAKFAEELPSEVFYPCFSKYMEIFGSSTNFLERKGAVRMLGHIAEPDCCLDRIKDDTDKWTTVIVNALKDTSVSIDDVYQNSAYRRRR